MTLIICLDDAFGMAFNRRRLSRDNAVYRDIAEMAAGAPICMDERSTSLFKGLEINISGSNAAFYFVEFEAPGTISEKADKLVLYHWNRRYPADLRCDIDFDGWRLAETTEFPGSSHEKISKEVYIRENK